MKLSTVAHPLIYKLLLFCSINLIAITIHGQANNIISGFVQDHGHSPIHNAAVELSDDFHRLIGRATTDGGGRYFFSRLPLGRYYMKVSVLGSNYEEQSAEVEITSAHRSATSAETVQQNFSLRQKSNDPNASRSTTGVIYAQDVPKEAQILYEKALSDLKGKKTDQGIDELKGAINAYPQYYTALQRLGEEYIAQQNFKEAVDVLTTATEINSRSYDGHYGLAYSLFQLTRSSEAIGAIDKSLVINPSSVNSLFLRGVILKQIGRYDEAVESLNKAKKLSPTPASDIHWQLSLIYTNNLKKYSAAATELELFLKAKPNYAEADKVRELIKKLKAKAGA